MHSSPVVDITVGSYKLTHKCQVACKDVCITPITSSRTVNLIKSQLNVVIKWTLDPDDEHPLIIIVSEVSVDLELKCVDEVCSLGQWRMLGVCVCGLCVCNVCVSILLLNLTLLMQVLIRPSLCLRQQDHVVWGNASCRRSLSTLFNAQMKTQAVIPQFPLYYGLLNVFILHAPVLSLFSSGTGATVDYAYGFNLI